MGNSDDKLVLTNASSSVVWRLAYSNGETSGATTFLTGNDFSITNYGTKAAPGVVRAGFDNGSATFLGYQSGDATTDAFSVSSTNADFGSPLAGQYSAVPEPSKVALIALSVGAFLFSLRRRVRA